ncbi:hypothetical protein ACF0H5_002285 [Mactra antiquata]
MKPVRAEVRLPDKSTKEFIENVSDGSGDRIDLKLLVNSLTTMQTRVNSFLTELVEQQRETTKDTVKNSTPSSDDDIDDDDDDDDDENGEPPNKQQKT